MLLLFDVLLFLIVWFTAQVVFHGFEAHVPWRKRAVKFAVITLFLTVAYALAGRGVYYALLALMLVGIAVLHGYYFHYRHGIHWRTAEPRDRYLQLVDKMKSRQ